MKVDCKTVSTKTCEHFDLILTAGQLRSDQSEKKFKTHDQTSKAQLIDHGRCLQFSFLTPNLACVTDRQNRRYHSGDFVTRLAARLANLIFSSGHMYTLIFHKFLVSTVF